MASADTLDLQTFTALAQHCGSTVAASTLAAVAKTESGFNTLAVNDNTTGHSHSYAAVDEAASAVERLLAAGDSVDIGLMQINSANLRRLGMNVRDALDACRSIAGGAEILTDNYLRAKNAPTEQVALRDAISAYNTGNQTAGYRNGYVGRVEQAARTLVSNLASRFAAAATPAPATAAPAAAGPASPSWDVWQADGVSPAAVTPATLANDVNVF